MKKVVISLALIVGIICVTACNQNPITNGVVLHTPSPSTVPQYVVYFPMFSVFQPETWILTPDKNLYFLYKASEKNPKLDDTPDEKVTGVKMLRKYGFLKDNGELWQGHSFVNLAKVDTNVKWTNGNPFNSLRIKNDNSLYLFKSKLLDQVKQVQFQFVLKNDNSIWEILNNDKCKKLINGVSTFWATQFGELAVIKDNNLWVYGSNYYALYGNGTTGRSRELVKVMDAVQKVSIIENTIFVTKKDESLWAWGENRNGQVGDGTRTLRTTPFKVLDHVTFTDSYKGKTVAITADNKLWVWGLGEDNSSFLTPHLVSDDVNSFCRTYNFYVQSWDKFYFIKKDKSLWCYDKQMITKVLENVREFNYSDWNSSYNAITYPRHRRPGRGLGVFCGQPVAGAHLFPGVFELPAAHHHPDPPVPHLVRAGHGQVPQPPRPQVAAVCDRRRHYRAKRVLGGHHGVWVVRVKS